MLTLPIVNNLEYETNQLYTVQEQTEEEEAEEETMQAYRGNGYWARECHCTQVLF
jgi:hypothetical protein